MKKLIPLFLFLLLLALPAGAESLQDGDYTYILKSDNTAEITGYTGAEADIVIPAAVDGHIVTSIGECAFMDRAELTNVRLPDSLTRIGNLAFWNCKSVSRFTLPDSLISIGGLAFWGCESLTHMLIPDSVSVVEDNPFIGCSSLTQISVSPEHPSLAVSQGMLIDKAGRLISCPAGRAESSCAVPEGIILIGGSAFSQCGNLTEIVLPDSITVIGDWAFSECPALKTVSLSAATAYIGSSAFADCPALTSLRLPASVALIGEEAFARCPSLLLTLDSNTLAEAYACANGLSYVYPEPESPTIE